MSTSPRTPSRHLSEDEIAELLSDYASRSLSLKAIEVKFGIHSSRVYDELEKAGIPRRVRTASFKDRIGAETVRKIVTAYREGETIAAIASLVGLNYDQIGVVIREEKLPQRQSSRLNVDDVQFVGRLAELYADETVSVHDVATELGISVTTLSRMVGKLDLPRRGRGGGMRGTPSTVLDNLAHYDRRAREGISLKALADEAGIGESTLRQQLRAYRSRNGKSG